MRLQAKVLVLLLGAFAGLFAVMAGTTLLSLKRTQAESITVFRNELAQIGIELLDNNADLFFELFDSQLALGQPMSREAVLAHIEGMGPTSRHIVVYDLTTGERVRAGDDDALALDPSGIARALEGWQRGQTTGLDYDNFDAFIQGDTTLVPTRAHFQAYPAQGLMLAYGKSFYAGKIRLDYIQARHEQQYRARVAVTILTFALALVLISSAAVAGVRSQILTPIAAISHGLRQIRRGDLDVRLNLHRRDEFGALAEFFDETVEQLRRTRREARQANHNARMHALGQLAAGVAHDFNNILAGIGGAAELLELELPKGAPARDNVETITRLCARAAELVRRLLDFGRKERPTLAPVDVHEVIEDAVALLSKMTAAARVTTTVQPDAANATVHGNRSRLLNAVVNLAINACHAMPDSGTLTIGTDTVTRDRAFCEASPFDIAPGPYLRLTVTDTGSGIAPEHLDHIFEPFFTTKEEGKGTGLGLASVYALAIEHRGSIEVRSELGRGTTFAIELPLFDAAASAAEEHESPQGPIVARVLVVETQYVTRKIATDMLRAAHYAVTACANLAEVAPTGGQATEHFDLVLLDLSVPDLNGRSAFQHLRTLLPGAKIVAMADTTDEAALAELFRDGLSAYIQRPLIKAELLRKLEGALRDWR